MPFDKEQTSRYRTGKHLKNSVKRKFDCDSYKKLFTSSRDLKRHKRIHTGEKPFKCNTCDKHFNQAGSLRVHEKVHSGERPFECETCKKSFNRDAAGHYPTRATRPVRPDP